MNKGLIISLVILVVVAGSWVVLKKDTELAGPVSTPTPTSSVLPTFSPNPTPSQQGSTVTYTDSGYSPATITIKKGQTVTWKNNSSKQMWTASAIHPTHKVYPGTDIALCGTPTFAPMLDSCSGISSGQSWSFTFVNTGTWKYHNHMNSAHYGTVIVE